MLMVNSLKQNILFWPSQLTTTSKITNSCYLKMLIWKTKRNKNSAEGHVMPAREQNLKRFSLARANYESFTKIVNHEIKVEVKY